jgi:4'-phosphopantetheinyl transferase EntD
MPLFKTIVVESGLIGIWQMSETSGDLSVHFLAQELENPEFLKYSFENRKVEWLTTRILIKQLIGPDFSIRYSEAGRPILTHPKYKYLSISHSRYFVTVFVHEKYPVGIDIEDMSRNYTAVKKRYLSDEELAFVADSTTLQCLYWCAKEAIFKLVPHEGIEFREQIHISNFNPEFDDHFSSRFINDGEEFNFQLQFQIFNNHGLVWVTDQQ